MNDVDKLRELFAKAFEFWVLLTLALWWMDRLPETIEAVLGIILVILFWPGTEFWNRLRLRLRLTFSHSHSPRHIPTGQTTTPGPFGTSRC